MSVADDVVQPSVVAIFSVTIDKEVTKPLDAIATKGPVKWVRAPPVAEAVSSSVGFVRDLTRDDLKKLAEICGTFKDAISKLHELVVRILD
uniref:Uncharacterized protein n=1 Tax=Ditylenchus dipsaci TaxID=166011 RepID=A0A915DFZ5_9BILA